MALTPTEIAALNDYTAAEMVKLWRHLIAELGSNPEATQQGPNGRGYTLRQLDEAQRMLAFWQQQVVIEAEAAEADGSGGYSPVVTNQEAQI